MVRPQNVFDCNIIHLPKIENRAGNITAINNNQEIPLDIKRVFYLFDMPSGESRGAHAHKKCHQIIIAASGSFKVLMDDGHIKREVLLNQADIALHVLPGIWSTETSFSAGAICLVLASHEYDASDYIRDYTEYKNYIRDVHS